MSLPFREYDSVHQTLVASTDTTITFLTPVMAVRVRNWDPANRVLVSLDPITSDSDATADRVPAASSANAPAVSVFPVRTQSIHLRSAGASEVTVSGYR